MLRVEKSVIFYLCTVEVPSVLSMVCLLKFNHFIYSSRIQPYSNRVQSSNKKNLMASFTHLLWLGLLLIHFAEYDVHGGLAPVGLVGGCWRWVQGLGRRSRVNLLLLLLLLHGCRSRNDWPEGVVSRAAVGSIAWCQSRAWNSRLLLRLHCRR